MRVGLRFAINSSGRGARSTEPRAGSEPATLFRAVDGTVVLVCGSDGNNGRHRCFLLLCPGVIVMK